MNNREQLRNNLNTIFLLLALIGVVLYFAFPAHHLIGLIVIGIAMLIKIVEFFVRFMF
jgi:energy-converting hydrogenase Eha subunit G